jgi:Fe-S cluster assembly protein SufD
VSEIVLNENSSLELYVLQNVDNEASIRREFKIRQLADSRLKIVVITFNGGDIRNTYHIDLDGEGAETQVYGLYLIDKTQHVENHLKVNHNVPHCTSNEKFKGVLDDEASGVFNGHVYVAPNAQKTDAHQNNSNIILTPKAKINSQPFLEIYADDVKCSHGTSTGQLDQEAMFYMRQRGISKANARILLMYAFAAEVSNHIGNEMLHEHIDDMIKRRLRGELSSCETCVLRCSHPKDYNFEIDYSKI